MNKTVSNTDTCNKGNKTQSWTRMSGNESGNRLDWGNIGVSEEVV